MELRLFRKASYTASNTGGQSAQLRKLTGPTYEQSITKRLGEARIRRGLMQTDLATALGIDQLISECERGVVRIHGTLLAALARELKVSADELLGLKTPRRNGDGQALLRSIDNFLKGAGVSESS